MLMLLQEQVNLRPECLRVEQVGCYGTRPVISVLLLTVVYGTRPVISVLLLKVVYGTRPVISVLLLKVVSEKTRLVFQGGKSC